MKIIANRLNAAARDSAKGYSRKTDVNKVQVYPHEYEPQNVIFEANSGLFRLEK
jgi:hypothetical protein